MELKLSLPYQYFKEFLISPTIPAYTDSHILILWL